MGTVNNKMVETLEMGYTLEDKTIRTPPVFPILTSPPPPQTKPAFAPESKGTNGAKAQNSLRGRGRKGLLKSIRKTCTKSS